MSSTLRANVRTSPWSGVETAGATARHCRSRTAGAASPSGSPGRWLGVRRTPSMTAPTSTDAVHRERPASSNVQASEPLDRAGSDVADRHIAVSYTHLTLPTIYSV